jgi:hypothetical protein
VFSLSRLDPPTSKERLFEQAVISKDEGWFNQVGACEMYVSSLAIAHKVSPPHPSS